MKSIMFTFESTLVKKVGGLAEVPPRLAQALSEIGIPTELYLPNHGFIDTCENPEYSFWIDGTTYCVKKLEGVKPVHYLIGGGVLDDPVVYSPQTLIYKSLVFARIVREYLDEKIHGINEKIVFHGHDWHSIPALLTVNSLSIDRGLKTGLVLHFHLSTKNKIELHDLCRITRICEHTPIKGDLGVVEFQHYYQLGNGLIERIGALIVDKVLTVSKGFSKQLTRYIGVNTAGNIDYVFNASPFTWGEVEKTLRENGVENPQLLKTRLSFREQLLRKKLEEIKISLVDPEQSKILSSILDRYGVVYNRNFSSDGPLLFGIGRLAGQKGFDYLLKILDKLTLEIPRIKIILALVPLSRELNELIPWIEALLSYPDHLRILPGSISKRDTILMYYASNATVMPSRIEPFGLVALESMAAGTPVAASKTGGLTDIVVDYRVNWERGNGVLFGVGELGEMSNSIIELVKLLEPGLSGEEKIGHIRRNCIMRAEEFNWMNSAEKTRKIYVEIV